MKQAVKQTADIATVKVNLIKVSIAGRGWFVKADIVFVCMQNMSGWLLPAPGTTAGAYNTHGHKLRFPPSKRAQFMTECGISYCMHTCFYMPARSVKSIC